MNEIALRKPGLLQRRRQRSPRRIVVYDTTDRWLSPLWALWAHTVGRLYYDRVVGVATWKDLYAALRGLDSNTVEELQLWCHGTVGVVAIGRLAYGVNLPLPYQKLIRRVMRSNGTVWLRCCSSFAGAKGKLLAAHLMDAWDCCVAGHTYAIGYWGAQSGYHRVYRGVQPGWGSDPDWPLHEGLDDEGRPLSSSWSAPRTVSVLRLRAPRW